VLEKPQKSLGLGLPCRLMCDSLEDVKRLIEQRYVVRQNLIPVIGICVSVYFCYHLIAGERSYLRLVSLNSQVAQTQEQLLHEAEERKAIEQKVVMMRPGHVDRDLLEEQARSVLGFRYKDEKTVIKN
jgi:cell division protein FtsB